MLRASNPAAKAIARQIEALLDDIGGVAEADYRAAFWCLANNLNDVIDDLDRMPLVPPVSGGAPDDSYEDLCEEFQSDPNGWPDHFVPELDAVSYDLAPDHDGETPVEVLAIDAPTWEPSAEDWEYLYAAGRDGITEADLVAAGLAVG